MRDPKRIEPIIKKLEEAWKLYPDMRLGQLLVICANGENIFGVEDDKLLRGIQKYCNEMKDMPKIIEKYGEKG